MTRTHDLLITNQLLYRLSYISLSIHDMVFLERHIQNRIYFIIFFDRRQQILLISCHTENAINKSNKGKSLVTLIFLSQSEVKKP